MLPFPHVTGGSRGLGFLPADVIYSSAFYGRGFSRVSRGGLTTSGGMLSPGAWGGLQVDAIIQSAPGLGGQLMVALAGPALPRSAFTSIIAPGLNGGARFLAAASSMFYPISGNGYDVTVWQWTGVTGEIAGGDVLFE